MKNEKNENSRSEVKDAVQIFEGKCISSPYRSTEWALEYGKISMTCYAHVSSRKEDVNIHSAVSTKNKIIDYYTNKNLFLSASIIQKKGSSKFKYKEKVSSKPLTKILDKTIYKDKQIDFLSIDAEGADYEVLKSLDFKKYKPKLICIEIWQDQIKEFNIKKHKIYKFLLKKKYKLITNLANNFWSLFHENK